MDPKRLLKILRLMEKIPLEYMVTGSIAAILYGKPRLTHDMDVVLIFPHNKIEAFRKLFDTDEFYCPPPETLQEEIQRGDGGHLNIIDQSSGFKVDLYPFKDEALVQWGFEHRAKVEILPGEAVWVAPSEYVIIKKLLYYKEGGSDKHLEDIRAMMEVTGQNIDKRVLESWISKLHLEMDWKKV